MMCLWNRPTRISAIVDMMAAQDGAAIDLQLWNNNRRDRHVYADALASATPRGALRSVTLFQSPANFGSMARFFLARRLALGGYDGPVVVLDDDEEVGPEFVASALRQYDPSALSAWWAFVVHDSYWERSQAEVGGPVDHIGPGGSVLPARLFADRRFFDDLPDRYWFLDDLWITWFGPRAGYVLRKLDADIGFVMDETNMYRSVIDLKVEFYDWLRDPARG